MHEGLNKDKRKWITFTNYVDVETGEIISKSLYEREYYKTGKITKKYSENESYRITTCTIECRKHGQQKLW